MRIGFLTATAWLDDDGYHVWQRHDCRSEPSESMLPWPTWNAKGKAVEPSLMCDSCGLHVFLTLGS